VLNQNIFGKTKRKEKIMDIGKELERVTIIPTVLPYPSKLDPMPAFAPSEQPSAPKETELIPA